jgi:hypothetical protein
MSGLPRYCQQQGPSEPPVATRDRFEQFLRRRGITGATSGSEGEQVFQEFVKWNKAHDRRQIPLLATAMKVSRGGINAVAYLSRLYWKYSSSL